MKAETNSFQQLGRTETKAADGGGVGPTVAWRAAFKAQLTSDMMDDVTAYAAKRASWIEYQTGIRDPLLLEEMVQNAIGDTFAQVVTWEPARCPLALHLKSVIRSRCAHDLDRGDEYERTAIDTTNEAEVSDAIAIRATGGAQIDRYVDEFTARIRVLAADDEPVLRLLELYLEGVTERRDICRSGPMSKSTYHNAFRRLSRLVEDLPQTLVAAARAAMA